MGKPHKVKSESEYKLPLPQNWREYLSEEEKHIMTRWSMWGSDCLYKVGSQWNSNIPGMPLFKTKKAAGDALDRFVCDSIPLRCVQRINGYL